MAFISKYNFISPVRAHLWSEDQQFSKMMEKKQCFFIALLGNLWVAAREALCTLVVTLKHAGGAHSDGMRANTMSGEG